MNKRQNISSGSPWEAKVGYSRAVRIGNLVEVAGTTASNEAGPLFPGDPYRQAQFIFLKIQQALEDAGAKMEDVIRTRMYVTDIEFWEEVGKAHEEVFKDIRPAATMVEVYKLIDSQLLVEVEVTAVIGHE
ncbi:MAG: RidA family protein [Bacteroidota bacterium]